jgi:hypothetical protein
VLYRRAPLVYRVGLRPGSGGFDSSVSGPVPVTATSIPFLAAQRNLTPIDLGKSGYTEEEFIISGNANVYDWGSDGSVTVKTANAPYATRILVRRPDNGARFSGNVIVEILHSGRRFRLADDLGLLSRAFH